MTELPLPRSGSRDRGAVRLEQGVLTLPLGHDGSASGSGVVDVATPAERSELRVCHAPVIR